VRSRSIIVAAAAGLMAAAVAVAAFALSRDGEPRRPAAAATAPRTTAARPPATAAEVLRAVGVDDVAPHLRALAAAARDGTRAAGTPGDAATREHLVGALRAAGWRVTVQPVRFPFFDERRPPRVTLPGGRALAARRDVRTFAYSPAGRASGPVRAVDYAPGRASDSGCRAGDFRGLRDGEVALVQRGTCLMGVKARNAQAAGAAAVLVANDGRPGRTDAIAGTLGAPGLRIPALFVSSAAARQVLAAGRVTIAVDAVSERRRTANVIAETGDGPRVAMAGAHLDSVAEGPGMNDNASGVAALLAAARALGGRAPDGVRLRLGFWGAEELGLYGSRRYVAALDRSEREAIAAYVNLDMVGSPGGRMAVYRGNGRVARSLRRGLRSRGRDDIGAAGIGNSSDHAPFARAGIPVGGVFTGLDRCYHRACDDADNVDPRRVADAAAATAAALLELSSP
jgi:Zn-dependent M28 family amino/carboxypeptidase